MLHLLADTTASPAASQMADLLGTLLAACLAALAASAVGWAQAHVRSRTALAVLDAVIKGVEDGDHRETKAAIQVNAEATGVQGTLDARVQAVTAPSGPGGRALG